MSPPGNDIGRVTIHFALVNTEIFVAAEEVFLQQMRRWWPIYVLLTLVYKKMIYFSCVTDVRAVFSFAEEIHRILRRLRLGAAW
jgi:hypothetical protein